jgi:hypothetical protein
MAQLSDLIKRVRFELGDLGDSFRTSVTGDGITTWFDLPVKHIANDASFHVFTIDNGIPSHDLPGSAYTMDFANGSIQMTTAPGGSQVLVISGVSYGMFGDDELTMLINDAVTQHGSGRTIETRYRNANGFIKYDEQPVVLENLPTIEEPLVAILATIESLWALSTDASTDIDVSTAEGTHLARSQRWAQITRQIDVLTAKYREMAAQLNVGLYRVEISTLRRVSLTTGRLVPVFRAREYDDTSLPVRELPPIDHRDDDESGVASPLYPNGWG